MEFGNLYFSFWYSFTCVCERDRAEFAAPRNTRKGAFRVIQSPRGRQEVLYYTLEHV